MAKKLETLVVKFEAQNTKAVKKAIKEVGGEFEKTGKKAKQSIHGMRLQTSALRRSLGAVRNNLLLVAFATEGARRAFSGFAQARGQLEQFEARLRSMSGSAEIAAAQLKQFMDIAATTPFTVEEIVQGGVSLQAFGADAEALIPIMGNLAAFMGRSVPEAANAFGRAFAGGRGAADVFREMGVLEIIDSFESLDETLNKEKLNMEEFRIKMIEALADPQGQVANGIKELEGTLFQSFSNMQDAIFTFQARVGGELQPFFLNFAKSVTELFNSLDVTFIRDVGAAIKAILGGALGFAAQAIIQATVANRAFIATLFTMRTAAMAAAAGINAVGAALRANYIGLFITAGAVAFQFFQRFQARQDEAAESTAEATKTVEEYLVELRKIRDEKALEEQNQSIADNIIKLQKQLDLLNATSEIDKARINLGRELDAREVAILEKIEEKKKKTQELLDLEKERADFLKSIGEIQEENMNNIDAEFEGRHEFHESDFEDFKMNEERKQEFLKEFIGKRLEIIKANNDEEKLLDQAKAVGGADLEENLTSIKAFFANKRADIERKHNENIKEMNQQFRDEDEQAELSRLEKIAEFLNLEKEMRFGMFQEISSKFSQLVKSNFDEEIRALRRTDKFRKASTEERQNMEDDVRQKFASQQRLAFRAQQLVQIAEVVMSLQKSIAQIRLLAGVAAMAGDLTAEARAARLIVGARITAGISAGLIAAQKMPNFATGGSFITQGPQQILVGDNPGGRERVDITPLSSPNIDGPEGSEVTVNIMGNVIGTQEFVRDTLIPEIDRSIRRNLA
tara:strand:+ start:3329 stop:5722 length:2394 start_codon:yes stop_codon:yes gene_type:complete